MGGLWVMSEDGGLWGGEGPIRDLGNRILESNMGGDPIFDGLGDWGLGAERGGGARWQDTLGGGKKLIHLFCYLFLGSTIDIIPI